MKFVAVYYDKTYYLGKVLQESLEEGVTQVRYLKRAGDSNVYSWSGEEGSEGGDNSYFP